VFACQVPEIMQTPANKPASVSAVLVQETEWEYIVKNDIGLTMAIFPAQERYLRSTPSASTHFGSRLDTRGSVSGGTQVPNWRALVLANPPFPLWGV
jgi:hypothetical protein